jgi:hypothetical protein
MKTKLIVAWAILLLAVSFVVACRGANSSDEKVIKSVKSGELTITPAQLANSRMARTI